MSSCGIAGQDESQWLLARVDPLGAVPVDLHAAIGVELQRWFVTDLLQVLRLGADSAQPE